MSKNGLSTPNNLVIRALLAGTFLALAVPVQAQQAVNVYTTREPGLIRPLFAKFTEKSGIKVNAIFVKDGLVERVKAEGKRSPADVLMTVDFGKLLELVQQGVTRPVKSAILNQAIPANLRDPKNHWFSLSLRARVLYAAKSLGLKSFTYSQLAEPKWKGKLCIRSGQHPYNTALFAAYLAHNGEAKTSVWLKGMKANLARKPGGGDRDVARDILGGICDIGIGNSYYVGLMRSGKGGSRQKTWGNGIDVLLPEFRQGGTHVNISGASIAVNAPNAGNGVKLLEYLVSPEAQAIYAQANFEYPVRADAKVDPIIAALGKLKIDTLPLAQIVQQRKQASKLVDQAGFNN